MSDPASPLQAVLRLVASAHPEPWYPSAHAKQTGADRAHLDDTLDQLRMAGLVDLTEWVPGKGQGYELTASGFDVVSRPAALARLTPDNLPRKPLDAPAWDGPPAEPSGRPVSAWERGEVIRDALLRNRGTPVTWGLIGLNVAAFFACMAAAPLYGEQPMAVWAGTANRTLDALGALDLDGLNRGQWWRIPASMFLHGGFFHLLMNMVSVFMVGPMSERIWGPVRFAALYLFSGIGGAFLAIWLPQHAGGVGASGCIWGLMVGLLAWVIVNRSHLPRGLVSQWGTQLVVVIGLNAAMSFLPRISWQAHFGGGAAGALAVVLLNLERFGSHTARWAAIAALVAVPLGLVGTLYAERGRLTADRDRRMDQRWADLVRRDPGLEVDLFNDEVLKLVAVDRMQGEAHRLRVDALATLDTPPGERDQDETARLTRDAEKLRTAVSAARDDLAAREPFRTPRVEAARQAGLARLDASAAFWSQVVEALKGGKPVSPELEKAGETLDDARRAWSRILKADPDE